MGSPAHPHRLLRPETRSTSEPTDIHMNKSTLRTLVIALVALAIVYRVPAIGNIVMGQD